MSSQKVFICPRCGEIFFTTSPFPICRVCEYEDIIEPCTEEEYFSHGFANGIPVDIEIYKEELRKKYTYSSPVFNKILFNRRFQAEQEELHGISHYESPMSHNEMCPKCASLDTTVDTGGGFSTGKAVAGAVLAGPAGALAGFAGSGKKHVCLHCGHRW